MANLTATAGSDRTTRATASPRSWARSGMSVNLFYLPAVLIFLLLTVYPLVSGFQMSFTNWNGYSSGWEYVGLENYAQLLRDPTFNQVLINTLIYGVGSTLAQQVLGLALALALDRPMRGRGALRAIVYLPVLVSPVIMGTMYYLLLQYNNGALNDLMGLFGIGPIAWLSTAEASVAIIVAVNSLQFVGLSMIIYLAGLQAIPEMYYEAARLDGAGDFQMFAHIKLPLLRPAIATSVILNLIGGLKLFDIIKVLTNGGPGYSTNSVSTFISVTYFDAQSAGYASAMGVALFFMIMVTTLVLNRLLGRQRLDA